MPVFGKIKKFPESGIFLSALIGVVVLGSIWGVLEATLGGFLHLIHFPYKGAIMGGIGMSIMATFVATNRRPSLVIGVGFIAALFKLLSALIYGGPLFAPFVVNPATAIILEGLAFGLVTYFLFRGFERSVKVRAGVGLLVGYLSMTLWGAVASIMGVGNWAFMELQEKVTYGLVNGTALAIVGVLLLPLGYMVGTKLRPKLVQLRSMRPKIFYGSSAAATVSCWIIAAFAFASGL
ncbi:MAG: hypothetical protein E3J75_02870 [Dehalococcoidia bacterium]|nr:MAG: hypothetical protein E3J75_02870 [Dehalococcoidia bacterium]